MLLDEQFHGSLWDGHLPDGVLRFGVGQLQGAVRVTDVLPAHRNCPALDVHMSNRTSAEFGISVRDDWHGRGLATLLMDEIEAEARRRGLEKVVGYVLKDNENMHGMMAKRGYVRTTDKDDPNIDLFTLDNVKVSN